MGNPSRKRGRRCAVARTRAALSVVLIAVSFGALACGDGDDGAGGAPGFGGDKGEVERSPFELALPSTTEGPTTIPGPGPTIEGQDPRSNEPGASDFTTTTTSTTTTTTTTLPDRIPTPTSNDLVCRAFFSVASGVRSGQNLYVKHVQSPGSVQYREMRDILMSGLDSAAERLSSALGSGPVTDVPTALLRRVRSTSDLVRSTTSFDQGEMLLYPLIGAPPEPGEPVGWPEIEASLNSACPELVRSLTGGSSLN